MTKLPYQRKTLWCKALIKIFFSCIGRSQTSSSQITFFSPRFIKITVKDNIESFPQFFKDQDFNFDEQTVLK